ncbi:MAG: NADH-quinone oxidoreductase subunit D [Armatimonadetes bacterium]|nr:NADH-quinone oxidoreductase subunit D [Armatimonadota bacterium]
MIETSTVETEAFEVNVGPQHPSTHGVLRLVLKLDGEKVLSAKPVIGYLHRATEKICEARAYFQIVPFTDRLDYLGSMNNNWGYCMAVERLCDIIIPQRAEYIRVVLGELNRLASHLVWYGTFALDLGAVNAFLFSFRDREKIVDLLELYCGARLTYNAYRIGGLWMDLPEGFLDKLAVLVDYLEPKLDELEDLFTGNTIFVTRTKGVGVVTKETALAYGLSGPPLRSTGFRWDLRRDRPYSVYPKLQFEVPVGKQGDCFDRYAVRMQEMRESLKIIRQCMDTLKPTGPFRADVPLEVKPPPGEVYCAAESPRGELGYYIVSDGSVKPYRFKIRAPSFSNLCIMPELLKGVTVADVIAIVGSIDIVLGEVDR